VLCDYLDTLAEQAAADPLANGRRLHGALIAALSDVAPPSDGYYADHVPQADGGYLDALVASCRAAFTELPAARVVAGTAVRAASRSAEAQSRNHAAMLDSACLEPLAAWCSTQVPAASGLRWWEIAAGACSSLTLHALLAAAADPATTAADTAEIEGAYFPWIAALSSLLDSVADSEADALSGNHSYVAHYATPADAVERLGAVTRHAHAAARALPHGRQHAMILTAMVCFYLTGPQASNPAAQGIVAQLDVDTRILTAMLQLRRRFG
jgi:tetraprenyl-beta-curcumene synthase